MMRKLWVYALPIAVFMTLATGICESQSVLTHHLRNATQDGTAPRMGQLAANQNLHLVIALPLRNEDQLDQLLNDLYDPSSPSYRQFLTVEQFTEQFGPTQEEYDSLVQFARENGLTVEGTSPNRLNLQVSGPATNVEAAFHVNFGVYQHPTENRTFYAPDREPTTNLTFSLWHISGLDNYLDSASCRAGKKAGNSEFSSSATTGSGPSASFLGSDMRAAYYGGTALTGTGQSVGLLEYYGTDLADLTTYFTNAKQTNSVPITLLSTDGTSTSCVDTTAGGSCDDTEQTLDMTQALGMAPGLSSLVMYVGSTDAAIFNAMATASPLNAQLSSSWTWYPADPTTDDPYFKEFAAQGQNLFQAAGDSSKVDDDGQGFRDLSGGRCVCDFSGRDRLDDEFAQAAPGPLKLPGPTAAAAFRRISMPSHRGRRLQRPVAPVVRRAIATAPMFRPTPTTPFTCAPIKRRARQTVTAAPALPHPCGRATWLSSISNR